MKSYYLIIDVGSTNLKASAFSLDFDLLTSISLPFEKIFPGEGLVEYNLEDFSSKLMNMIQSIVDLLGKPRALGITNQRATTVLYERSTLNPVYNAISWQDIRTAIDCITYKEIGFRFLPNASATKVAWIVNYLKNSRLSLEDICFGTLDTYVAATLSGGEIHATDMTNAGVTGLLNTVTLDWDTSIIDKLEISEVSYPQILPSSYNYGYVSLNDLNSPITALVGDQQSSMIGQGCISKNSVKFTFGTGAMLDAPTDSLPSFSDTFDSCGLIPIIAVSLKDNLRFGFEGLILSAGSCVDWLCKIGMLSSADESEEIAKESKDEEVIFVPAMNGLGSPIWDFGARSLFYGISRSTTKADLVNAVLKGLAYRSHDVIEALVRINGQIDEIRIDGKVSKNEVFCQHMADVLQLPVKASMHTECTSLGAAYLAAIEMGDIKFQDINDLYKPRKVYAPSKVPNLDYWESVKAIARNNIPELSAIKF